MRNLHIRAARPGDLPALIRELGERPFFADRIRRQESGRGLLLTAWRGSHPIGFIYLWLEPAEERELRDHLPGRPILMHLEIHVAHRSQGAGTALLRAAERVLLTRGYRQVALAVEITNVRATKLYLRLGYREWSQGLVRCYSPPDERGRRRAEICRIFAKRLRREF